MHAINNAGQSPHTPHTNPLNPNLRPPTYLQHPAGPAAGRAALREQALELRPGQGLLAEVRDEVGQRHLREGVCAKREG